MSDQGLSALAAGLKDMKSLTDLSFNFRFFKLYLFSYLPSSHVVSIISQLPRELVIYSIAKKNDLNSKLMRNI